MHWERESPNYDEKDLKLCNFRKGRSEYGEAHETYVDLRHRSSDVLIVSGKIRYVTRLRCAIINSVSTSY